MKNGRTVRKGEKVKAIRKEAGTHITVLQRMVLAAVLGGSNLGMPLPTKKDVDFIAVNDGDSFENMVYYLWSRYMEDENTEQAFLDECNWWFTGRDNLNSKKVTVEYVRRVWPDVAALVFDTALPQAGDPGPALLSKLFPLGRKPYPSAED